MPGCDMSLMNALQRRAQEAAGPLPDEIRETILRECVQSARDAGEHVESAAEPVPDEPGLTGHYPWRSIPLWVPSKTDPAPDVHFEIYRAPEVSLTSVLRCGGDWRWRLRVARGGVLASGEGYRSEQECADAVELLKYHAACAPVRRVCAEA